MSGNMDNVFKKTRELGEALLESDVYLKMKDAEDKAMANPEAAQTMAAFLEKRGALQAMMQSDNPDPGAMKRLSEEMDGLQDRLQRFPRDLRCRGRLTFCRRALRARRLLRRRRR